MANNGLKGFRFFWRNPEMGITDQTGSVYFHPEMRVVFANSYDEALKFLTNHEHNLQKLMRAQMAGRPTLDIEALIVKVFSKTEMSTLEFEIEDGVMI